MLNCLCLLDGWICHRAQLLCTSSEQQQLLMWTVQLSVGMGAGMQEFNLGDFTHCEGVWRWVRVCSAALYPNQG